MQRMMEVEDDDEFESLLANLPLPAQPSSSTTLQPLPLPSITSPTCPSSSTPPPPRPPPLSLPQLLTEWVNVGKDVKAGRRCLVNDPVCVLLRVVRELYDEVQAEQRAQPALAPVSNGVSSTLPSSTRAAAEAAALLDDGDSEYRASLSARITTQRSYLPRTPAFTDATPPVRATLLSVTVGLQRR